MKLLLLTFAAFATLASALPGPVPAAAAADPEAVAVVRSEEGARLQARCDAVCWHCYPGGCDCVC